MANLVISQHHLCGCCLGSLQCDPQSTAASAALVPEDDVTPMKIQCDICHQEYQEEELQPHRDACMPRLVLQCAVCQQHYLSKEGLWNHLDQHEIADDNKDLYYEEKKAKHVLHQCEICNDQRGYQESSYWQHIHEDHDGFFIRCSACGDSFRSRKLETDHRLNYCGARAVPADFEEFKIVPGFSEKVETSRNEQLTHLPSEQTEHCDLSILPENDVQETVDEPSDVDGSQSDADNETVTKTGQTAATTCGICRKTFKNPFHLSRHHDSTHRKRTCKICRIVVTGSNRYRYHKLKKHSEPIYKCVHCEKEFHLLAAFRRHMITHTIGYRYQCNLCDQRFKALYCLQLHTRRFHRKTNVSGAAFRALHSSNATAPGQPSTDLQHAKEDHKLINCTTCGMSFDDEDQLRIHETIEHSQFQHKCPHCARRFHLRKELDDHIKKRHAGFTDKPKLVKRPPVKVTPMSTMCSECDKECYNTKRLMRHIDSCHALMTCDICKVEIYGRHRLQYHKAINHKDATFQCPQCPKNFNIAIYLRRHLAFHSKQKLDSTAAPLPKPSPQIEFVDVKEDLNIEQREDTEKIREDTEQIREDTEKIRQSDGFYWCAKCEKRFSNKDALTRHDYYAHKPTTCNTCGVVSLGKHKAVDHELKVHAETKMKCPHCPKIFHKALLLRRHVGHHLNYHWRNSKTNDNAQEATADQTSTVCTICGEVFANVVELRDHQIMKHSNPEQDQSNPSVTCEQCNKVFDDDESLRIHYEDCHLPVVCNFCGLINSGKRRANNHKLLKHSAPTLQCPQCPKKLSSRMILRRHLKKHDSRKKITNQSLSESAGPVDSSDAALDEVPNLIKQETMDLEENYNNPDDAPLLGEDLELQQRPDEVVASFVKEESQIYLEETSSNLTYQESYDPGLACSTKTIDTMFLKDMPIKEEMASESSELDEDNKALPKRTQPVKNKQTNATKPGKPAAGKVICPHCERHVVKRNLTKHIIYSHKEYTCSICKVTISGHNQLRYHKLTQHSEPQYECSHCARKFHLKSMFRRHLQTHTKATGVRTLSPDSNMESLLPMENEANEVPL